MTQPIRYLLAGGGTAGHVNPLLAVADRIVRRQPTAIIRVLGTAQGLESRLVPERGYELITVARLPFPRRINSAAIHFSQNFAALVTRIAEIITDEQIDVVVGFGGYVSAPAYLAARRVGVPFVIHEANAKAGMANRLGAMFTPYVGVAFNAARLPHRRFTGMPLRAEIESLDRAAKRAEALAFFGLDHRKPTLLVTGGSQGAQHINETVNTAAALILGAGWQILHITGTRSEIVSTELADYKLIAYCDRMDLALAAADLAVARAGAATVSEFSALGLPAVYVPLAIGNGEQKLNATDAVKAGGALIVNNADFTPLWVSDQLVPLLLDRALIAEMAARTVTVAVMDGADRLVDLINEALASRETDKQSAN